MLFLQKNAKMDAGITIVVTDPKRIKCYTILICMKQEAFVMEHKYIIHMMDPEDWLRSYDEGTQNVNDFILPRGPRQKDEVSDTVYHKDAEVPYHQHEKGFETFLIARGSVECFIRGRRFVAETGDIVHLPPWTPHGFHFLEEGTIWRELFQEIDMSQGILEKNQVKNHFSEYLQDPDFLAMYRAGKSLTREQPVAELVDKRSMHELRAPDFAFSSFEGDGFSLKLKVGKWETAGVKEVWQARLSKGLNVEFHYPHKNYTLLYVESGKLEVKIMGQSYIAEGDCLIDIPPYHTYDIRVLENAVVYDYGGETDLMALLEDLKSVHTYAPERIAEKVEFERFLRKYSCYATKLWRA